MPSVDHRDGSVDNFVPRHKVIHRGALKRLLLATVFSALAWGQVFAADAPQKISASKPKSPVRTIKQMIELAMRSGISERLNGALSKSLGLPDEAPQRIISYGDDKTPDHRQHDFVVILDSHGKASSLLWTNLSVRKETEGTFQEHTDYASSLSGKLKAAVHGEGVVGHGVPGTILNVDDPKVAAAFKRDKEFILITASSLKFETE